MREAVHRLVFLDETGTTTKLTRLRGRARRGSRLKADAPFGHWATQTFIAGLRCGGLTAPWVIDHPMNRETFDTYVETQLAPTLQHGDVVAGHLMDLLAQDFSYSSIVSDLNEKGYRTRAGKPWSRVAVFNMMPRLIEVGPRIFNSDEWEQRRAKLSKRQPVD